MAKAHPVADWRDPADYEALRTARRPGIAWEWLRRSAAYQLAAAARTDDPRRFGLHRFAPFDRPFATAWPVWTSASDPFVLFARARRARDRDDAFDITSLRQLATCSPGRDGLEHWLFSDGAHALRLDIEGASLRDGPLSLSWRLNGFARLPAQLAALARLAALRRHGRLLPSLYPPLRRAPRLAAMLRVHDALAEGAALRDIAAALYRAGATRNWRAIEVDALRRTQRLVAAARRAAAAAPTAWLDGTLR